MPNYIITEYDIVISTYKVNNVDNKQIAIDKIARGDLIQRAIYRANGFKKQVDKKKYKAKEIANGKTKEKIVKGIDKKKAEKRDGKYCYT